MPIFNFYDRTDLSQLEAQMSQVSEKLAELLETIHAEKDQVALILSTLETLKADFEADKLDKAATIEALDAAIAEVKGIAPDELPPAVE
jgi:ABC-type transporter Mla subunit MlaD